MKNIVLIGMPGTGKSTVGVVLAKRLGYAFLDTDLLIMRREGRTLPVILEQDGIERFLEAEGRAGLSIDCEDTVIATGGSMVFSGAAMEHLRKNGVTVWLSTPVGELERRLADNALEDRGVAAPAGMTLEDIYALRRPFYEKYADIRIDCEQGTERAVSQIRAAIKSMAK